MDPPPLSCKEHRPRGHDFGQVQGMNSQNENPNKALQVTAHKAPNLNADVRDDNNDPGVTSSGWTNGKTDARI